MKRTTKWITALAGTVAAMALTTGAAKADQYVRGATLQLFDGERFYGRSVEINGPIEKLDFANFNDKAASLSFSGPGWLLCKDAHFEGPCLVAREPISDLDQFGLGDEISSARPLSDRNPYPHGTIFGVDWSGDVVFYDVDYWGNLSQMDPYDAWGYSYGDGYTMGSYGEYGRYGGYNPYNPVYDYDPNDWDGYRGPRNADIVLYRDSNFRGSAYGVKRDVWDMTNLYFNDEVSSIEIRRGTWEVCTDSRFGGRCYVLDASVNRLNSLRLNDNISSIRRLGGNRHGKRKGQNGGYYNGQKGGGSNHGGGYGQRKGGHNANATVIMYEHSNYGGRYVGVNGAIANLSTIGLNDGVSSIQIKSGSWEICSDPNFGGRCQIVNVSQSKLNGFRLNDNISSIRPATGRTNGYKKASSGPANYKTKAPNAQFKKDIPANYGKSSRITPDQTAKKPYPTNAKTYREQLRSKRHAENFKDNRADPKKTVVPKAKAQPVTKWTPRPRNELPKVQNTKPINGKHAAIQNATKQKPQPKRELRRQVQKPQPKPVAKQQPKPQKQKFKDFERNAKKYRN